MNQMCSWLYNNRLSKLTELIYSMYVNGLSHSLPPSISLSALVYLAFSFYLILRINGKIIEHKILLGKILLKCENWSIALIFRSKCV